MLASHYRSLLASEKPYGRDGTTDRGAVYEGDFELLPINSNQGIEMRGWMAKFRDLQIDFADACLAHLAALEGISAVFTVGTLRFLALPGQFGKALDPRSKP